MVEVTILKGVNMNLDTLEALAKAADDSWYVKEQFEELGLQEDAAYLVAANPETILRLIALLREMGEALEHCQKQLSSDWTHYTDATDALNRFKEME